MNKSLITLAALLAVQLALAGTLAAWQWRDQAAATPVALYRFEPDRADRITIEGPDEARTVLHKQDGHWRVEQAGDFAADAGRVKALLDRLGTLKAGAPEATSQSAAERFKVADKGFERRVTVQAGEQTLAALILGESQTAGKSWARKPGDDAIYAVKLPTWDVPAQKNDWLDKTALQMPKADITAIEVAGLTLTRVAAPSPAASAASGASAAPAKAWQAEGLPEGDPLDPAAADRLAGLVADLRFASLRGKGDEAHKGLEKAALALTVQRKDGKRVDYKLFKLPDSDDQALTVSTRQRVFVVGATDAKALIEAAKRDALVPAAASGKAGKAASAPEA